MDYSQNKARIVKLEIIYPTSQTDEAATATLQELERKIVMLWDVYHFHQNSMLYIKIHNIIRLRKLKLNFLVACIELLQNLNDL